MTYSQELATVLLTLVLEEVPSGSDLTGIYLFSAEEIEPANHVLASKMTFAESAQFFIS